MPRAGEAVDAHEDPHGMKTVTVRLPETLVADIEAEGRARHCSRSAVIRERLARAGRCRAAQPA
jgi:hypothetical protein